MIAALPNIRKTPDLLALGHTRGHHIGCELEISIVLRSTSIPLAARWPVPLGIMLGLPTEHFVWHRQVDNMTFPLFLQCVLYRDQSLLERWEGSFQTCPVCVPAEILIGWRRGVKERSEVGTAHRCVSESAIA